MKHVPILVPLLLLAACAPEQPAQTPTNQAPEPTLPPAAIDEQTALRAFLDRHQGEKAHADLNPRAAYRLALLQHQQVLASDETGADAWAPVIEAWSSLWTTYPSFERASVAYYLGRALAEAGRVDESQQVLRVLVCSDRFNLRFSEPATIVVESKPQDHDASYWERWRARRLDDDRKKKSADDERGDIGSEENTYKPIYDASCKPLAGGSSPGGSAGTALAAEVWTLIGDAHAERSTPSDGPYALNRAATAYQLAIAAEGDRTTETRAIASANLASVLLRQGRLQASLRQSTALLDMLADLAKSAPLVATSYVDEAAALAASALALPPRQDPGDQAPLLPRPSAPDWQDEDGPAQRAQSTSLLPQDKRYTLDIYAKLASQLVEDGRAAAAVKVLDAAISKAQGDARLEGLTSQREQAQSLVPSSIVLGKGRGPTTSAGRSPALVELIPAAAPIKRDALSAHRPAFAPDPALPLVRACYARAFREQPAEQGRLVVRLKFAENGALEALTATGSGNLQSASACVRPIASALDKRALPRLEGEASRTYYGELSSRPLAYDLFDGEVFPAIP